MNNNIDFDFDDILSKDKSTKEKVNYFKDIVSINFSRVSLSNALAEANAFLLCFKEGYSINVLELAKKLNIEITYDRMLDEQGNVDIDISGYIECIKMDDGKCKFKMHINDYHSENRQKFTIAHEIGHFLMHKDILNNEQINDNSLFRDGSFNDIEQDANSFASEILMPEADVKKLIQEENIRNIKELSLKFNVSMSAMKYRLYKLKYIINYD